MPLDPYTPGEKFETWLARQQAKQPKVWTKDEVRVLGHLGNPRYFDARMKKMVNGTIAAGIRVRRWNALM